MSNLLYKELRLSIHRVFFFIPFVFALLLFIPQWIFTIAFSYFFWISASNLYSSYNSQQDSSFCSMLPVAKRDIVLSKIYALFIIEGLHIVAGLIMAIVHNQLYGSTNFLLDMNVAFFGIILGMYALFNVVFLPMYFKTAYHFGKPVIIASIVVLVYAFIFEYGVIRFAFIRNIVEGELATQFIVLGIGIVVAVVLSIITINTSIKNYESID